MIHDETDNALAILKLLKKYKNNWFYATAVSYMLDIPKSRVKGILTVLVGRGLIEQDNEYFYRFKENKKKMITAEEVKAYQEEQKKKLDVTSLLIDIEEVIKENMLDLGCSRVAYSFKKPIFKEQLNKLEKVLEDNGYTVVYINPSYYYEFGGITIKWES